MDTFHWSPRPAMGASIKPSVTVVKFGDGYEQRRPAGINHILESYSPVFRVSHDEFREIEAFFRRQGAVKAFLWRSPQRHVLIRVVCREWSEQVYNNYVDVSCKFDQVAA
ncbi:MULTISPECIES: phage tail protein [Edwardsiella]|uniref:Phage tail protein n=3 Tax=Edwardsiella TaxID=635 RepID=A0AAQ3H343_EDWPI|nr:MULTISPECIES: phage tail protein [Edwardsiella]AGH74463.1 Minor tail protein M [Edwardsiella piscicida C07-087]AOP43657.1 phage tail protein [Edwardsiella piscicida]EKS7783180.1 phage tail protein [Edwardsiella piscicida]EKS7813262.1 phage tail protein [Edwardsiella piscicida]ELM3737220.1 phage tail protein [Edwardsiella piscicida]